MTATNMPLGKCLTDPGCHNTMQTLTPLRLDGVAGVSRCGASGSFDA